MFARDYYNEENSFMSKVEGAAKIAGIIGVAVGTRPMWSKGLGSLSNTFARELSENFRLSADTMFDGTLKRATENLFSDQAQIFTGNSFTKFRSFISSAVTQSKRKDSFINTIEKHVVGNLSDEQRKVLEKLSTPVARAGSVADTEIQDIFLSTNYSNRFASETAKAGITFSESFQRHQARVFSGIAQRSTKISATEPEIFEFLDNGTNQDVIEEAFRSLHASAGRRRKNLRNVINTQSDSRSRAITFEDLEDETIANSVSKFFETVGVNNRQSANLVSDLMNQVNQNMTGPRGLFMSKSSESALSVPTKSAERMRQLMLQTETGLRIGKDGQVFSEELPRKQLKELYETALSEVTLPLVPWKFAPQIKTFRLLKKTEDSVRSIGALINEPELARKGIKSEFAYGIGIGERMLVLDPSNSEISITSELERVISYKKRDSSRIKSMADIRSQNPDSFMDSFFNGTTAEDLQTPGIYNKLVANKNKFTNISWSPENGFSESLKPNFVGTAVAPFAKGFLSKNNADITTLHPTQLSEYLDGLDSSQIEMMGDDYLRARTYTINQAGVSRSPDIAKWLQETGKEIYADPTIRQTSQGQISSISPDAPFRGHVGFMLDYASDPKELSSIMDADIADSSMGSSELFQHATPAFQRAVETARSNPADMTSVGRSEGGFMHQILQSFEGDNAFSELTEKVQEGLLSEVMAEVGQAGIYRKFANNLANNMGLNQQTIQDFEGVMIRELETLSGSSDPLDFRASNFADTFRDLGFIDGTTVDVDSLQALASDLLSGDKDNRKLDRRAMKTLGMIYSLEEGFMEATKGNREVGSRALKLLTEAFDEFSVFSPDIAGNQTPGSLKKFGLLESATRNFNVTSSLKDRFGNFREFLPENRKLSPENVNGYLSVSTNGASIDDWLEDPIETLRRQAGRAFGTKEFIAGFFDPNAPLGPAGLATQMVLGMPQTTANIMGIGLSGQDRLTGFRTLAGFYGKRVLPLLGAYELYKNTNEDMHNAGLPGIDDVGANTIANVNLTGAKIKDFFGLTEFNQNIVDALPGLDMYFNPRSEEEYRDYLYTGEEEVRDGRFWLIGSRSPFTGGPVKYVRPNFYRRWKSHWTEEAGIADSSHSFLPSLTNPLGPLNRILDSDYYQREILNLRRDTRMEAENRNNDYFSINASKGEGGAYGIGSFGMGLPAQMNGGGTFIPGISKERLTTIGGAGGKYGEPLSIKLNSAVSSDSVEFGSLKNKAIDYVDSIRSQAGLYGAFMQKLPFYPEGDSGFSVQDPNKAKSFNRMFWMGDYGELMGPFGEFFRRFVPNTYDGLDAYSPYQNDMPTWLPQNFSTGNPYLRTQGPGELLLPGPALEAVSPWIRPMKARGSMIGMTEQEMIQKWLDPTAPIETESAEDIVDFGSEVHKLVQQNLNNSGMLVGAEVSIYDKENNISGTIDAVVRDPEGLRIVEIKTQGEKSWGNTPDKYLDQLTFYMHETGIHQGTLAFINRDDPSQKRFINVDYDENRFNAIVQRLENARGMMTQMVEEGKISPYETYDLISRVEILARVAPNSPEFRKHVKFAQVGGLGGEELKRLNKALDIADKLSQDYNLYSERYDIELEERQLDILDVYDDGSIETELGKVKLAGIEMDPQAFIYKSPQEVFAEVGIVVGKSAIFQMQQGQFNSEGLGDQAMPAIVGDSSQELIRRGYADKKESRNALDRRVTDGPSPLFGVERIWDKFVHSDNLITNKFLRVRTGLEQFERGEVFGTDETSWANVTDNYIKPTLASIANKNPIEASLQLGGIATMFFRSKNVRAKAGKTGAAIGAALSLGRIVYELTTGEKWVPKDYKKATEFDEYWDKIAFIKYTAIAKQAREKAASEEGVDIVQLSENKKRSSVGLGPWAVLAIDAERKARRTMTGFDAVRGSLQEALAAIPKRHRQIAQEIIESGSLQDKHKFYELLPDTERYVLGKFLNQETDNLPMAQNLSEFFKTHFLPDAGWEGWNLKENLEDIKTRSAAKEKIAIDPPSRRKEAKARARSSSSPVPVMRSRTAADLEVRLREITNHAGLQGLDVNLDIKPATNTTINVDMDVFQDKTDAVLEEFQGEINKV